MRVKPFQHNLLVIKCGGEPFILQQYCISTSQGQTFSTFKGVWDRFNFLLFTGEDWCLLLPLDANRGLSILDVFSPTLLADEQPETDTSFFPEFSCPVNSLQPQSITSYKVGMSFTLNWTCTHPSCLLCLRMWSPYKSTEQMVILIKISWKADPHNNALSSARTLAVITNLFVKVKGCRLYFIPPNTQHVSLI